MLRTATTGESQLIAPVPDGALRAIATGDEDFAVLRALDNAGLSETVSTLERQLEATLAHPTAGVIVREPGGRMVFANAAAAERLGAGSLEELFGTTPEQLMARLDAYDEGTGR